MIFMMVSSYRIVFRCMRGGHIFQLGRDKYAVNKNQQAGSQINGIRKMVDGIKPAMRKMPRQPKLKRAICRLLRGLRRCRGNNTPQRQ